MTKQSRPIEFNYADTTTRSWRLRSSKFVLSLIVTSLVTGTGTWIVTSHLDKERIAEARADAIRAEAHIAFIETWAAAEVYALEARGIQLSARMNEFGGHFDDSNPVAVIFRKNYSAMLSSLNERRKQAEYTLSKNRIQLSNQRYQLLASFLALVKEGPYYEAPDAAAEAMATAQWIDHLDVIRTQAKNLEQLD